MFFPLHGDPNYNAVSLLLPMEGANDSTTFADVSATPKTVTRSGNAKISTTQSKWGNGSGYFDGDNDYLTVPHASDFEFGTGDFTVEAWVNLSGYTVVQSGVYRAEILGKQGSFEFRIDGTASSWTGIRTNYTGESLTTIQADYSFALNQWYHLAWVRSQGTLTIYINGTSVISGAVSGANAVNANAIAIGGLYVANFGYYLPGYLQDLRVTKGVARYTANFTPPMGGKSLTASDYATIALPHFQPSAHLAAWRGL